MAFSFTRFSFKRLWTSAEDFPTIEVSEEQVRADMQALHDEMKDGLNHLMDELETKQAESNAADSIGALTPEGSASTVQKVLNALHTAMQKLTGTFGEVSVTTTLGADNTTIPTSKAVSDAMSQAGNLPAGGTSGQVLVKASDDNYDMTWASKSDSHATTHAAGGRDPITPADIGAAAVSHTQGANTITAGTFSSTNVKAAAGTDYGTGRLRNIKAGTDDLTAGTSALDNGAIHLVYE